jgi:hypothetical protein
MYVETGVEGLWFARSELKWRNIFMELESVWHASLRVGSATSCRYDSVVESAR